MAGKNRYRQLAGDMGIFMIGTVLAKAIQFFLLPFYTSYMTTAAYGTAELTNNMSELFFPVVTLCIYEAAFRFAVDPDVNNGEITVSVSRVLGRSMLIGLAVALPARLLFHYEYAYYLYFILYAYSFRMCAAYYARGKGLSKQFAVSGIINAAALGVLSVILLAVLKEGEKGYLLAIGGSYTVSGLYLFIRAGIGKDLFGARFSRDTDRVLLGYGVPLIFYNVLYWFTTISGRYILMWYTDASTAGLYVAAIKIAAIINMLQQAVYAAFQLNTTQVYESGEDRESYYSSVINLFIALYSAGGAVIVCASPLIAKFTLRGDFYEARMYLPIILFSALLFCISSLLGTLYSTYKRTKQKIGVSIVGTLVNLGTGIALVPGAEIWGVCIASVLCYLSQAIYMVFDIRKFCSINYRKKEIAADILLLAAVTALMSIDTALSRAAAVLLTAILITIHIKDLKKAAGSLAKED